MIDFGRVVTAMVTPFRADGSLDTEGAVKLARYLADHGTDTILLAGTTGESPTLTSSEKMELIRAVKAGVPGVQVMAGTGSNNTQASIDASLAAEEAGADALLLVVPYYNKPSQEGLYQHFRAIAESTSLPCMLYNVPGRTSRNLEAATVARLAEVKNIVALKAACGDLDQVTRTRLAVNHDFMIYSGDDMLTLPMLTVGASGVVSVAGHLLGQTIQEMFSAWEAGDTGKATEKHLKMYPFFKMMFMNTNPIPIKYATSRVTGLFAPVYRLPMVPPSPEEMEIIDSMLKEYEMI